MEDQRTQLVRVLAGAAVGAGFAFLFLTKGGRRLHDSAAVHARAQERGTLPRDGRDQHEVRAERGVQRGGARGSGQRPRRDRVHVRAGLGSGGWGGVSVEVIGSW